MDDFYRMFARRAALHYPLLRRDAERTDNDDTVAWAEHMRHAISLAADDIANLLNIIEALSGERFRRES